jgi:hypothetical protein
VKRERATDRGYLTRAVRPNGIVDVEQRSR